MSDDKKNISIEVGMPTAATALEQSAPDKAEPIVTDPVPVEKTVPADKAEPAVPEYPRLCYSRTAQTRKEGPADGNPGQGRPRPGTFRQSGGFCRCP